MLREHCRGLIPHPLFLFRSHTGIDAIGNKEQAGLHIAHMLANGGKDGDKCSSGIKCLVFVVKGADDEVRTSEKRKQSVTVTQPCFATADPARLDMLPPTPDEASRRDTSLIQELNTGTVFILRPGDKGVVEGTEKTKLLVRFQGGPLWVWRSDVAS